jgi:hypothetical protein
MWRVVVVSLLAGLAGGCGRSSGEAGGGPAPSAAPSATPKGTLALGERITSPLVPLGDVAAHPSQYASQVIATSGKVTAVCQEMGCWMELRDESGTAHVRMHGHSFFVPKTASGHIARVQAKVVKATGTECDEEESKGAGQGLAKVELDATGVELD